MATIFSLLKAITKFLIHCHTDAKMKHVDAHKLKKNLNCFSYNPKTSTTQYHLTQRISVHTRLYKSKQTDTEVSMRHISHGIYFHPKEHRQCCCYCCCQRASCYFNIMINSAFSIYLPVEAFSEKIIKLSTIKSTSATITD